MGSISHSPHVVVAVDGPAASGKSSVSRRVASALGFKHVDTGSMYRAATWLALENGLDPVEDDQAIARAVATAQLEHRVGEDGLSRLYIDGVEPGVALKSDQVNGAVSHVARIPEVREILVDRQRSYATRDSLVMEGRDIGSVVFPHTPHKFYLDARPEVRAQRRSAEGSGESIAKRDQLDKTRKTSPLVVAEDAQRVDTSDLSLDQVVVDVLGRLRAKGVHPPLAGNHPPGGVYGMGWRFFRTLATKMFDLRLHGAEHIPARGPMLLISNHVSFIDPPLIGINCPEDVHFVARKTLFRNPVIGWVYRNWNAIPLDQERPQLSTMRHILELLKTGHRVVLFPEGERTDGPLGEAQVGAGWIAARSGAPILPCRIFGAEKIMPVGKKIPRPGELDVVVGEPFSYTPQQREAFGTGKDLYRGMAADMMAHIAALELPPQDLGHTLDS